MPNRTIETIKYILRNAPHNNEWNNIWFDERSSEEAKIALIASLQEAGFITGFIKSKDPHIPDSVSITLGLALRSGLEHPTWGDTLKTIKDLRNNEASKAAAPEAKTEKPKANRLTSEWFTIDPVIKPQADKIKDIIRNSLERTEWNDIKLNEMRSNQGRNILFTSLNKAGFTVKVNPKNDNLITIKLGTKKKNLDHPIWGDVLQEIQTSHNIRKDIAERTVLGTIHEDLELDRIKKVLSTLSLSPKGSASPAKRLKTQHHRT